MNDIKQKEVVHDNVYMHPLCRERDGVRPVPLRLASFLPFWVISMDDLFDMVTAGRSSAV